MRYIIQFLIPFLLLVSACSSDQTKSKSGENVIENPEYGTWQELEEPPFELRLVDTFDLNFDNVLIGNVSYLLSDLENNLYFLDSSQNKLISIDANGNLRWETGQEGRGPGDFLYPFGLVMDGDFLYVSNIMATRMDKYDREGNYIQSYNFGEELYMGIPVGVTSSGQIVVRTNLSGKLGSTLNFVDVAEDSLIISEVQEYDQSNGLEVPQRNDDGPDINVYGNTIIEGNAFDYGLTFYDQDQDTIKKVTRAFGDIVPPGSITFNDKINLSIFSEVNAPYFLNDGYYLVKASWPSNIETPDKVLENKLSGNEKEITYKSSLDLFNADDELLYSFESDGKQSEFGKLLHSNRDGFIYFVTNDPAPAIQKYELILE